MIRYVTSVIINLQKCGLLHGSTRRRIEEVCAKDARRSCWYAIRILNGQRFPAGGFGDVSKEDQAWAKEQMELMNEGHE